MCEGHTPFRSCSLWMLYCAKDYYLSDVVRTLSIHCRSMCYAEATDLNWREERVQCIGVTGGGYWHLRADERLGDPPPKVDPGAFSGQRQGWKTPKRTLLFGLFKLLWEHPALHDIYFIRLWHDNSLYVLKMRLNTKQTNEHIGVTGAGWWIQRVGSQWEKGPLHGRPQRDESGHWGGHRSRWRCGTYPLPVVAGCRETGKPWPENG